MRRIPATGDDAAFPITPPLGFLAHLFTDRKAIQEDIKEVGVILVTAGIVSAALDHSKFFTVDTLPGGITLVMLGMLMWIVGHYD